MASRIIIEKRLAFRAVKQHRTSVVIKFCIGGEARAACADYSRFLIYFA